ncbi:unnamed protein product [Allacma fusca]|uniref:Uncharacterized protein n=1 Tax=Allacma fusca TaxID=39272 RepID=A0A8J2PZL1_9HEXA|nr:unnamed protein product [Allacma fusca]
MDQNCDSDPDQRLPLFYLHSFLLSFVSQLGSILHEGVGSMRKYPFGGTPTCGHDSTRQGLRIQLLLYECKWITDLKCFPDSFP